MCLRKIEQEKINMDIDSNNGKTEYTKEILEPVSKKSKRKESTICILKRTGKNLDMDFIPVLDEKIKINGNNRVLPDDNYYLTNANKLKKVSLKTPIKLYIIDSEKPESLKIEGGGENVEFSNSTMDKLLDDTFLSAMLKSMQVSFMQMFVFGSAGVVVWEILKMILELLAIWASG